jgi:hypothetical protein
MGIKGLTAFLRKQYPQLFEVIHISEYHHKRIAIDTSLFMCQYKANYGDQGWLSAFIKLVSMLRENEVHCVFIYDSGFPPEKEAERKERAESREKMQRRVCELEDAIDKYQSTGEIDPVLFEFQERKKIVVNSLLRDSSSAKKMINIKAVEYAVTKMRRQLFSITPQDYETTKKLFDILDIPYFNAPMEAETMCSDLCIQGKVDAVSQSRLSAYGWAGTKYQAEVKLNDIKIPANKKQKVGTIKVGSQVNGDAELADNIDAPSLMWKLNRAARF